MNALVKTNEIILSQEKSFKELALIHGAVNFKAEASFAMQILKSNNYLANIAFSNPDSLKMAIINVAAIGLSLSPSSKHAYLLPRKGQICLDISYMGLIHLAVQSAAVEWVQADLVYELDNFIMNSPGTMPEHKRDAFKDRGKIDGVYCVAKLLSGDYLTTTMTINAVLDIRDRSEAWKKNQSGPWKTDFEEMVKKTVVKRAAKMWPKASPRLLKGINVINEHEGIDFAKEDIPDFSISKEDLDTDFPQSKEDIEFGPRFLIQHGTYRGKRLEEIELTTLKSYCIVTANKMRKGTFKGSKETYINILNACKFYFDNLENFEDK